MSRSPRKPRNPLRAIALLAAAVMTTACGAPEKGRAADPTVGSPGGAEAPLGSVVLVTVDAIRADQLSTYGGPVAMPNLDRLAATAVVFDDASTPTPMSRPAAAALLTGLPPDRNGVRDNVGDRLPSDTETLAAAFSRAGRRSAAFVASPIVGRESGLDRGFGLFDSPEGFLTGPTRIFPQSLPAQAAADNFAKWLATVGRKESFFAWIHLADLHGIISLGPPLVPDADKWYRDTLGRVDAALGSILSAVDGAGRPSVEVVVVGTHGELLSADGPRGSDCWLRRETLRVPLVWRRTGAQAAAGAGGRSARKVTLLDVAATLAARAGSSPTASFEGKDVFAGTDAVGGPPRMAWTWAPDDRFARSPRTAVETADGWKSFDGSDLDRLRGTAPAAGTAEAAALARPATPRRRQIEPSLRARMEAAGVRFGAGDAARRALPSDDAAFVLRRDEIAHALGMGRFRIAEKKTGELLRKEPEDFAGLYYRLYACLALENLDEATKVAEKLLATYPERQESLHWAAHVAQQKKDLRGGEVLLEAAYEVGPPEPDLLYDRACARSLQGDTAGAFGWLEKAIGAGFHQWAWIEKDPDLVAVRADPRFAELMRSRGR